MFRQCQSADGESDEIGLFIVYPKYVLDTFMPRTRVFTLSYQISVLKREVGLLIAYTNNRKYVCFHQNI